MNGATSGETTRSEMTEQKKIDSGWRKCQHGVPLSEACDRCAIDRAVEARDTPYDRATRRISRQLLERYRAGEFDTEPVGDHLQGHGGDQGMQRFWDDVRKELSEAWSVEWKRRRALGMEVRAETVRQLLTEPVRLPEWLDDMLSECGAEFTPRQVEALVYRYGYGLSLQEAAVALGIRKQTFRKRLDGAERKVGHLRGDVDPDAANEEELARAIEAWARSVAELLNLRP
jgi:hypothetical protein